MIKKYGLFLFLLMTVALLAESQPSQTQAFLPKVLPASPEAAGIARYGNIPVNMFTGVPDISIPLYEIQVGELRVPITLSYHAAGNKVSDIPSRAGLGWSISAGGTINRRMMGKPDEQSGNYLSGVTAKAVSEINTATQAGLDYLWGVTQGNIDAEPDIYSYSFPGKSGKFVFNQRDNFKPIIMPYDPITISRSHPNQSTMLFSVTDEGGIQYKFDAPEWTSNSSGSGTVNAISSWMLTQMISSNKQDTISFSYNNSTGSTTQDSHYSEYIVVSDEITQTENNYSYDPGTGYVSFGYVTTYGQVPTEIVFKNGKVVFEAGSQAREDFNSTTAPNRLNAIKVYNYDIVSNSYNLIRIIQFYHSYFINGTDDYTKRLRLDAVSIMSSTGNEVEKYSFEYNTAVGLPRKESKMKDFWGYYNNKDNSTLVPRMQIPYTTQSGTTNIWIGSNITDGREPDPNYMQAWVLNKLYYPTGGYTEFEFETNKYLDEQSNVKYAGGLRIKKLKNYDGITSTPIVKTYKYGTGESGNGRANFILNNYFFQSSQTNRSWKSIYPGCAATALKRARTFFSNPTIDIEPYDGSPVVYPYVTEYVGDETNNQGRTIYQFNDHVDPLNLVTAYGRPIITTYHFNRGQLIDKLIQKKTSGGIFKKVSQTTNAYEYFAEQSTSYLGLVAFKWRINQNVSDNFPWGPVNTGTCPDNEDTYSYRFENYSIRTGDNRLKETSEIVYDENDDSKSFSTLTKYYYDNFNHMQVTRVETTNSRGETLVNTRKYPHDMAPTSPYNDMVTKNMWNRVVEEKLTNTSTSTQLSLLKNNYSNWGNDNYLPGSIDLQVASNANETRAQFTKYNIRGSIQEMNKSDDVKMVYIWDYQNALPVAEVVNAAESEVAYTSFESDGKGNWTFSGTVNIDPTAISGKRVYNLSNGAVTKSTGLSSTAYYILSYWTKNSSAYSISGTQSGYPIAGPVVNGWRCFIHKVYGVTTVSLSGSGLVDEVRLYPFKATMATSTYEPLIGASCKIDVNNIITYYDYDAAGRLKVIRDQNRNVRKVFCYNYTGQTVDCNSIYKNVVYNQSFTRNNCGSGYTGGSVTYTVPANTYVSTISQADADAKAQADALLNGQNYANVNGTCTPNVTMYNVNGYNTKAYTYNVKFTNNSTGQVYTFTLPANTSSASYRGQVPAGTYTVQFFPQSNSVTATFYINGYSQYATGGAIFYNISVNATALAYMN